MANSSKKEIDLLVRIGTTEKLLDKLFDRVAQLEGTVKITESNTQEILKIVADIRKETEEVWEDVDTKPSEKTEGDADKKPAIENDELNYILDI